MRGGGLGMDLQDRAKQVKLFIIVFLLVFTITFLGLVEIGINNKSSNTTLFRKTLGLANDEATKAKEKKNETHKINSKPNSISTMPLKEEQQIKYEINASERSAFQNISSSLTSNSATSSALKKIKSSPASFYSGSILSNTAYSYYTNLPYSLIGEKKNLLEIHFDKDNIDPWRIDADEKEVAEGKIGNSAKFKPFKKMVIKGGEVSALTGTISFWLRLGVEEIQDETSLINWNFDGVQFTPFIFELSFVEKKLLFSIYDESVNRSAISSDLEKPVDWHFIMLAWDFSKKPYKRLMYIDDSKKAEDNPTFVPKTHTSSAIQIGGGFGRTSSIEMSIDELKLTNFFEEKDIVVSDASSSAGF